MKQLITILAISFLAVFAGCSDDHDGNPVEYDYYAPLPPTGIVTTSLDQAVRLDWIENQESDISGYNIYVSDSYDGEYILIGNSRTATFTDYGITNGVTYYYAVTAYDFSGNESNLSKDVVYDTPRPEGLGVALYDRYINPNRSGYDFSQFAIVNFDTDETDFYIEYSNDVPFLVVLVDSDVQDMGYTVDLDEISVAPEAGWSPTKDAHIIAGHTYVIWTYDNHFAKVRVREVSQTQITFDWAYQTATGNPELFQPGNTLSKTTRRSRHTAREH